MIHAISNLQRLDIERKKAVLSGEKARVELAVYGPGLISVFYLFEAQAVRDEAKGLYSELFSERFADAASARVEWEEIIETDSGYEFRYGPLRLKVDKRTATISVYRFGVLVHGGRIGDADTVLSAYPLRVQEDEAGRSRNGKFNFRLEAGDAFFGLGEKSGPLNKRNRAFKLFNRDALGYDAAMSDPLYKSVPFLVKANREKKTICGLYFPNMRIEDVNLGVESQFYYYVSMGSGPYGYFLMTGDGYRDVMRSYADLTGKPALPPLFSFGYLGSSMAYTDPDDAEKRTLGYFDRVEREDIPCEGMYFSSGYAKADNGERYTFVWNKRKFSDPQAFLGKLRARGYRICCNVKPGILTTHPWYPELARKGVFVPDATGEPYIGYYWGNTASFVDFSSREGFIWWVEALTEHIIRNGASGVWNDNNEFELEDESLKAQDCRSFMPVLMAKASYAALRAANPGKRPWVISRAGYAGLQRYARTWTGDNVSDFNSMNFNIAMGLNLGLSGLPVYGHDIGGFFGPPPDKELLIRWCQSAVFQPRFVMHSWKADGEPTEPWTHPDAADVIADIIRERYRFLPYVYNLAIRAAETGLPMESALALEFPEDTELSYDSLDRMSGDAVLVPAPPGPGESAVELRLPAGSDWYDPVAENALEGGRIVRLDFPLSGARYLFRCGSVVPTDPEPRAGRSGGFPSLVFLVIPSMNHPALPGRYVEDDGESDFIEGSHFAYSMEFVRLPDDTFRFVLRLERRGERLPPLARRWRFRLPAGFDFIDPSGRTEGGEAERDFLNLPEELPFTIRGGYPVVR